MARRLSSGKTGKGLIGVLTTTEGSIAARKANTGISLEPSGTGIVTSTTNLQLNNASSLIMREAAANGTNTISLKAPASVASDIIYTLPGTITNNYFLKTDASGNLSWAAAAVAVSNQTTDTNTYYPIVTTSTSGTLTTVNTSNTKLSFVPSTGALSATSFSGTSATLTGALSAGSITETSSITLKENIQPINNALEAILGLNGVTYDRKDKSSKNEAGLIAEEVEKILPNLVVKKEGQAYGINYTKFSAYLIEAIKDLVKEIDELKGKK